LTDSSLNDWELHCYCTLIDKHWRRIAPRYWEGLGQSLPISIVALPLVDITKPVPIGVLERPPSLSPYIFKMRCMPVGCEASTFTAIERSGQPQFLIVVKWRKSVVVMAAVNWIHVEKEIYGLGPGFVPESQHIMLYFPQDSISSQVRRCNTDLRQRSTNLHHVS